jgi:hypothetical protein
LEYEVMTMVGAMVSTKVTVKLAVPEFPAASYATTVMTFGPG